MARSQDPHEAKVNSDYADMWFPARIIGVGKTPNTFELLFDEKSKDGEEDRHDQTFPYLDGTNPRPGFLRGQIVGTGTKMIDVVSVDYTWDSKLTKKAVASAKRKW